MKSLQRHMRVLGTLLIAAVVLFGAPSPAQAQGGGGGLPRLDILIDSFKLTKDQEKAVKTLMDESSKTAMPIRDGFVKTRPAIVAAIQAGKSQAEIDAAVHAYAIHASAMAELEMRTLAKLIQALTAEQRANQNAMRSTVSLMHNAFVNKNWNEVPNPDKSY